MVGAYVYQSRTTSRLILNEISLVAAISPFVRVQVVQFDGLSYREQVRIEHQIGLLFVYIHIIIL